ncbi:hypothetical protein CARN8_1660001 [mine drainage metagenome]|uniref:Uncharacterized protein n=1 Tax=mine drainage metagenome TaxID=410659 RepID=A0A3P3ZM22_9ZZZZ
MRSSTGGTSFLISGQQQLPSSIWAQPTSAGTSLVPNGDTNIVDTFANVFNEISPINALLSVNNVQWGPGGSMFNLRASPAGVSVVVPIPQYIGSIELINLRIGGSGGGPSIGSVALSGLRSSGMTVSVTSH